VSESKRTQRQIQKDKFALRWAPVGDKRVEENLQEIEFMPSTIETIDGALLKFLNERLDLFVTTNEGFKQVPVIWSSAERSFQIKGDQDLRDKEHALILPMITLARTSLTKEQDFRGSVYANLYPIDDPRGGTITVARRLNQNKTSKFQNATVKRTYGAGDRVKSKGLNAPARNQSISKTVYETITMPIPTWVKVTYSVALRTEYQQQMNDLLTPFVTIPGNSRTPRRLENEGHFYEMFIDGGFSDNSNAKDMGMERRNFETDISIEVLGYLMGEGPNRERPKIIKRQNAVEVAIPREHVIMGDIPDNIKDGKYRE